MATGRFPGRATTALKPRCPVAAGSRQPPTSALRNDTSPATASRTELRRNPERRARRMATGRFPGRATTALKPRCPVAAGSRQQATSRTPPMEVLGRSENTWGPRVCPRGDVARSVFAGDSSALERSRQSPRFRDVAHRRDCSAVRNRASRLRPGVGATGAGILPCPLGAPRILNAAHTSL
jgi:hypothetical protein